MPEGTIQIVDDSLHLSEIHNKRKAKTKKEEEFIEPEIQLPSCNKVNNEYADHLTLMGKKPSIKITYDDPLIITLQEVIDK